MTTLQTSVRAFIHTPRTLRSANEREDLHSTPRMRMGVEGGGTCDAEGRLAAYGSDAMTSATILPMAMRE